MPLICFRNTTKYPLKHTHANSYWNEYTNTYYNTFAITNWNTF
jgi:hypothetical protein